MLEDQGEIKMKSLKHCKKYMVIKGYFIYEYGNSYILFQCDKCKEIKEIKMDEE